MNNRLKKHIEEFNKILNFNGLSWWIIDVKTNSDVFYCNKTMVETFSLDSQKSSHSVSQTCPIAGDYLKNVHISSAEKAKVIFDDYKKLLSQEIEEYNNVFPYFCPKKQTQLYFSSRAKALTFDDNNEIELLYGIIEDKTTETNAHLELQQQRIAFKSLSEQDHLTQICNRRRFMELYEYECAKSRVDHTNVAILMIDIDYFKNYNDHYGHIRGDECLVKVAKVIELSLRKESDLVGRYGGEEFIVLITNIDLKELKLIAEKILVNIRHQMIPHDKSDTSQWVTVSIGGIVGINESLETPNLCFIEQADKLLYQAKAYGRNNAQVARLKP